MPEEVKNPKISRQQRTESVIKKSREFQALDKKKMNEMLTSRTIKKEPTKVEVKEIEKRKKGIIHHYH